MTSSKTMRALCVYGWGPLLWVQAVWGVGWLCLYPVAVSLVWWRVRRGKRSVQFSQRRPTVTEKRSFARHIQNPTRGSGGRVQDVSSHIKNARGETNMSKRAKILFFCLLTHQPVSYFSGGLTVFLGKKWVIEPSCPDLGNTASSRRILCTFPHTG